MHPAEVLLQTLRFRDGPEPERLRAAWAAIPTQGLDRLVEFEQCSLWLWRRLQQLEATDAPEPGFTMELAGSARAAAAQNMLVDEQTDAVLHVLAAEGVPSVLLKGAARRSAAAWCPLADARATHDVDVLVPASRARAAWDCLRASGYEFARRPGAISPQHFHLPPLWDRSRVAVELHTSTSPAVPPEEAWRRATAACHSVERAGLQASVPPATELFWHGLTHALLNRFDAFRLRFLLDGAAIWAGDAEIDWREIGRRLVSPEVPDPASAAAWLMAAGWLAGAVPPVPLPAAEPRFDLERALRWRLAVVRLFPPHRRVVKLLA
ncbi:MAG TPA: nucleotidyltransferase family protein, partial [Gemmatimonadales bacterium]|nr:nucleotidyltransferase family protein [Gemmatimonadales bacterium]